MFWLMRKEEQEEELEEPIIPIIYRAPLTTPWRRKVARMRPSPMYVQKFGSMACTVAPLPPKVSSTRLGTITHAENQRLARRNLMPLTERRASKHSYEQKVHLHAQKDFYQKLEQVQADMGRRASFSDRYIGGTLSFDKIESGALSKNPGKTWRYWKIDGVIGLKIRIECSMASVKNHSLDICCSLTQMYVTDVEKCAYHKASNGKNNLVALDIELDPVSIREQMNTNFDEDSEEDPVANFKNILFVSVCTNTPFQIVVKSVGKQAEHAVDLENKNPAVGSRQARKEAFQTRISKMWEHPSDISALVKRVAETKKRRMTSGFKSSYWDVDKSSKNSTDILMVSVGKAMGRLPNPPLGGVPSDMSSFGDIAAYRRKLIERRNANQERADRLLALEKNFKAKAKAKLKAKAKSPRGGKVPATFFVDLKMTRS